MPNERLPVLPGGFDVNIGPLVNRTLKEGPEFLGCSWLDRKYPTLEEFGVAWNANLGAVQMYVLEGAIIAPIVRSTRARAALNPPYGLVHDLEREKTEPRQQGEFVTVDSLHDIRSASGMPLNPYRALRMTTDDTLRQTLDQRMDWLEEVAKNRPNSPKGRLYHRFSQLDELSRQFYPKEATVLHALYNGIGTGTSIAAAILKVIPEIYKSQHSNQLVETSKPADLFKETAANSYGLVAELGSLDKSTLVSIQFPLFMKMLNNLEPEDLNAFQITTVGGKPRLDLTDATKFAIWDYAERDGSPIRLGCPFMAAVDREFLPQIKGEQVKRRAPGIEEKWHWMRGLGGIIYEDLHGTA